MKSIRDIRIFKIAVVDLVFTVISAVAIAKYFKLDFIYVFIVSMLLAIILHRIFRINSTINKLIFGRV